MPTSTCPWPASTDARLNPARMARYTLIQSDQSDSKATNDRRRSAVGCVGPDRDTRREGQHKQEGPGTAV